MLYIRVDLPDQAVLVALISGCTTIVVTSIRTAARVGVAWIQRPNPGPPPAPGEIEPPDP